MFTWLIVIGFVCLLGGMGISVWAFGTGGKRANIFKDIYFSVEDVDGIGIIYTKLHEFSAIIRVENPVQKYSADIDSYYEFTSLLTSISQLLGEGYAIHKQDIFVRKRFDKNEVSSREGDITRRFLSDAYFRHFDGREYMSSESYLIITQEKKKVGLVSFDNVKWRDFLLKLHKVYDRLKDGGVRVSFLSSTEVREHVDRFFAMNYRDKNFSMTNFNVDNEEIGMGDKKMKVYSLLDVDSISLPGVLRPYMEMTVNNSVMPVDLMSEIDHIPDVDTLVYNQVIFLPNQKRELSMLEKKKNRHASLPNPSNEMAAEDIRKVQEVIAKEGKQLIYAHFNIVVSIAVDKDMQKVTNHLENVFSRQGIHLSKRAYNQLELFVASFPGNCFRLNPDYDRFLTLSDAAWCLMYKERQTQGDDTPLKCYYTNRQGVPMAIDITGKEGKRKYTTNANFFVLGPSGSGKSFFMNTMCRQLYEQNTDLVIVDTGDSYEGLNAYFNGTYISYTKEHPISMNPFKVTLTEYSQNFNEKKGFLRSLVFLIFKGAALPTKIEETIINQVIVEYYREYFTPFEGYTASEREELRSTLLLQDKKNGEYDKYEHEMEQRYGDDYVITELDEAKRKREERLAPKLQAVLDDTAATEGVKEAAKNQLMRLTPEIIENKYLARLDRQIEKMEQQRKKMKVEELSFNTFYEFAIERIPQITKQQNIQFAIDDFAAILAPFYKGGELEYTLNNDMDSSLFDEQFIVFEIDKVKDDSVLFPIIVLIIMDVFTQKMRIKKNRKCLVIEEAWKAIATPVMAEYIKYLYKTARKHWAMVGVVTQEIQDITSSPIVKEAIINNSDVFMLLDQSKFKEKFNDIKATLALSDIDCKKIFTINRLDNKSGRSPFKEVFIKRGPESGDVFGVEEPRECYMSYTTEKAEKEALKLYKHELRCSHQEAIEAFIRDWDKSGIKQSLAFAQHVNKAGKVLNYGQNVKM